MGPHLIVAPRRAALSCLFASLVSCGWTSGVPPYFTYLFESESFCADTERTSESTYEISFDVADAGALPCFGFATLILEDPGERDESDLNISLECDDPLVVEFGRLPVVGDAGHAVANEVSLKTENPTSFNCELTFESKEARRRRGVDCVPWHLYARVAGAVEFDTTIVVVPLNEDN